MTQSLDKYLDQIIQGDATKILLELPEKSVDLIFADPPYNLQLQNELYRPNQTRVDGVFDAWDRFESFQEYDDFTRRWLIGCRRVLKDDGAIWVIGSYHNIFRVGAIMQELGFWFLNDVIWIKHNPMPNFRGTRFTNAHETLIWAAKHKKSRYTFHYKAMKVYNDDKQMRSDWYLPIASGNERVRVNGRKAHSTQKPEALLFRVLLATTDVGDVVLDPFMGSGTTGAVAKRLRRHFIGIERDPFYVQVAEERIRQVEPIDPALLHYRVEEKPPRVPFGSLIETGLIHIGERLYSYDKAHRATVLANATLETPEGIVGSIHQVSAYVLGKKAFNGWKFWYVEREGRLISIDSLRAMYLKKFLGIKSKQIPLNIE